MIRSNFLAAARLLIAAPLSFAALLIASIPCSMLGETCTTQSAMQPQERTDISEAARTLAVAVQANDAATLRTSSTPEIQKDFGALQYMVTTTSPKLVGGAPQVDQVYVLDASSMNPSADGSAEAQFFCTLNKTTNEADFLIPGIGPGKYGFAIVSIAAKPAPWRLSMLLRQDSGKWQLAGIYPKQTTLAGHDGLWYWTQARQFAQQKQAWNAWLYYQEAMTLLRPADFVLSTHLEKLHTETTSATPPALSEGISANTPLTIKGTAPSGGAANPKAASSSAGSAPETAPADLHYTSLALMESATDPTPVLSAHLRADALLDPNAARLRNGDAARALLAAYPELRAFHTLSITTDSPGQPPLTTSFSSAEVK